MDREVNPSAYSNKANQENAKDGKGGKISSKNAKYEEFTSGGLEDALTKTIKLLANLSTEEEQAVRDLQDMSSNGQLQSFIESLMAAIQRKQVEKSDEFILTAISCTTNMLFYDTAQSKMLTNTNGSQNSRLSIFQAVKPHLLSTSNEEIQVEAVRVISNLSRHSILCNEFLDDATFI